MSLPLCAQEPTSRVVKEHPFALRCLDELGQPIEGAGLIWGPRHELTTKRALEEPLARSDADGWIRCTLPVSEYYFAVLVAAPGHASWVQDVRSAPNDRGMRRLATGTTARGQVYHDTGGRKVPIAGARVELFDMWRVENRIARTRFSSVGTTDAEGRFSIDGVLTQGVHVAIEAPGHYRRLLVAPDVSKPIDCEVAPSGFYRGRVVAPPSLAKNWTIQAIGQNHHDGRRDPLHKAGTFEITIFDPTPTWLIVRDQGQAIVSELFDPVRDAVRLRKRIYLEADIEGKRVVDIRVRDLEVEKDVVEYRVSTEWHGIFTQSTSPALPWRFSTRNHKDGRSSVFLLREHGGILHIDAPGYERESRSLDHVDRRKELVINLTPSPVPVGSAPAKSPESNAKVRRETTGVPFVGRVRGLPPGVDHRVRITRDEQRPASGHRIEIGADGSFEKQLDVQLPVHVFAEIMARPRHGPQCYVKLGTITEEGEAMAFEGIVPPRTALKGNVRLAKFRDEHRRFLVLASCRKEYPEWAWVEPDGSFELHVNEMPYGISLHDACTGRQLHNWYCEGQRVDAAPIVIEPRIAAVDLYIPNRAAFCLRLSSRGGFSYPSNLETWMLPENGLDLPGCQSPIRIFLPEGRSTITIIDGYRTNSDGSRRRDSDGDVLQQKTLELKAGDERTVKFEK